MKLPDAVEEEIEADIFRLRKEAPPKRTPALATDETLDADYLKFLRGRVLPGAKLAGMRVVLDCANGAADKLGPELFRSPGADVIAPHLQPHGENINAGRGSPHTASLGKRAG